jgi:hypothetical protein
MYGDFSRWRKPPANSQGVLHQQGRVLLDSDWNAATQLANRWQERAAQHIIGRDVLAVSIYDKDAFKVTAAQRAGNQVRVQVQPGAAWADGLAVELAGTAAQQRVADYLPGHGSTGTIATGVRDAVVLEVYQEALNAFQRPDLLLEPALQGPDTTERLQHAMRFRLARLTDADTCETIADSLKDDPSKLVHLRATLQPTIVTAGDCPVVEGGGYTGFEHALYRIEIAQVTGAAAKFKWSQFNGGLVGRGLCDLGGANPKVTLTANDQAIRMSGLDSFYMEIVEWDADRGIWSVTYGAEVTLNDNELDVTTEHYATAQRPTGTVFFRLWNGIALLSAYPTVTAPTDPTELQDGIRLEFATGGGKTARPGDFWLFDVRAGGIEQDDVLVDSEAPHGIRYRRVPVAILNWGGDNSVTFDAGEIDDCRDVFRPLTKQTQCCRFSVGDGKTSFGDFDSIEEALHHLPDSGGEICLLPGIHETNATIDKRKNVIIGGCQFETRVIPRPGSRAEPIFKIVDSTNIVLQNMDMVTLEGSAVVLMATDTNSQREIVIHHNRILAFTHAVANHDSVEVAIQYNLIRMLDKEGGDAAIFSQGDDILIERNDIGVIPASAKPPTDDGGPDGGTRPDPTDPCADPEVVYTNWHYMVAYVKAVWLVNLAVLVPGPQFYVTSGGIRIANTSERVRILENRIRGGASNGITLGSRLSDFDFGGKDGQQGIRPRVQLETRSFWATVVDENGDPLKNEQVLLTRVSNGQTYTGVTDGNGIVLMQVPAASYDVDLPDPYYDIVKMDQSDQGEFGNRYIITAAQVEPDVSLPQLFAPVEDITIATNVISDMGLSGVGVPEIDLEELAALAKTLSTQKRATVNVLALLIALLGSGSQVIDLHAYGNEITRCALNIPQRENDPLNIFKGYGGITLGLGENIVIRENFIEANGRSYLDPVCGVYMLMADYIDVSENQILSNGPIVEEQGTDLHPGLRGGVVILFATSMSPLAALDTGSTDTGAPTAETTVFERRLRMNGPLGASAPDYSTRYQRAAQVENPYLFQRSQYAGRIHNNLIEQPVGPALLVLGLGPILITDNQFNVDVTGVPGTAGFNALGAVTVLNLGTATLIKRTGLASAGNVMFDNNQTRVLVAASVAAQMIISLDDVSFSDNQCDVLYTEGMLINSLVFAPTVRANNNRLKEPVSAPLDYRNFEQMKVYAEG